MTNEKYTFVTDLREKKAAARGAFHKRSGAKTKRCTLPSDYLSPAQLKRRNGPVKTFNISTCIKNYDEFKKLPTDLKQKYINDAINRFNVNVSHIAEAMGTTGGTLRQYLYSAGIKTGRSGPKHPCPEWEDFVNGDMNIKGEWILEPQAKYNDPEPTLETPPIVDPILEPDIDEFPEKTKPLPSPEPNVDPIPEEDKPETSVDFKPLTVELPLIIRPTVLPDKVSFTITGTPGNLIDLLPVFTKPDSRYRFELTLVEE